MSKDTPANLYLVDGSAYIFRAYHALPSLTRKSDGLPIGAVSGFCNMLYKLIEDARADAAVDYFAVILDAARETFRNEIYPDYKGNRPPAPEDLVPQFPLIRDASRAFGLPTIEMDGFEADDIIASYARIARKAGVHVTIVSSDKDLMQLVGDGVEMLDPMKQRRIGPDEVVEKFGVGPDKVIEVQALCGDSTDNVPGVPGIGVKTAAQLITEYGDLENLLAHVGEIKQPKRRQNLEEYAELARISKELVTLKQDVPLELDLDALKLSNTDPEELFPFLEQMEFVRLAERIRAKQGDAGGGNGAAAAMAEPAPGETEYVCVQSLRSWSAGSKQPRGPAPWRWTRRPPRSMPCRPTSSASRFPLCRARPATCRSVIPATVPMANWRWTATPPGRPIRSRARRRSSV